MTHRTMSERSYHGATSRSLFYYNTIYYDNTHTYHIYRQPSSLDICHICKRCLQL